MNFYESKSEALVAAARESERMLENDDVIKFDGQNCADAWDDGANCEGWDGNSRRCECGNRRVNWVTQKYNWGWGFYAEAY